ncbi:MAG: DNA-binding protein [Clostridia bacterium]|nr:DNA-binding protein [Clostridia bacterium]
MKYKVFDDTVVVRLFKGEELVSSLMELCEKEDIKLGCVTGLGAADYAVAGLFDTDKKQYYKNVFTGDMEIVSLVGNITQMNGAPYLHLHASFADKSGAVKGGHLNEAVISATAEIFITKITGQVSRAPDPDIGLNMLDM